MAAKSKSEKFPPPHRDGAASIRLHEVLPGNRHLSFVAQPERSFESTVFDPKNLPDCAFPGGKAAHSKTRRPAVAGQPAWAAHSRRRNKSVKTDAQVAPAQMYGLPEHVKGADRVDWRLRGKEIQASG